MFNRLGTFFLDILEVVVFAVGIFFFVYLLVMQPHKIDGASMDPNFHNAEYLLTERVTYYFRKPQRGDVIVFSPPVSETDEFIKRVIAVPGERIELRGGRVYINETLLEEPYLADDLITEGGTFLQNGKEYTVPEGEYFVMGDNRLHSSDSRSWGPILKKKIKGRAWVAYWPLSSWRVVKNPTYIFKSQEVTDL